MDMAIAKKLRDYLKQNKVKFEVTEHPVAYSAARIASAQHVPGSKVVKSVICEADGNYVMCVLDADHLVDLTKLKRVTGAKEVHLATEEEIAQLFPDFEVGAEPPFGNLFGLSVYADQHVSNSDEIFFNGGNHTDLVKVRCNDFMELVRPIVADFGRHI
jgi:Ala-tRNA(Pro) deacylase